MRRLVETQEVRERDKGILILLGKAVGWGDRVALMVSEIVTGVRDGRCRKEISLRWAR